LGVAGLFAARGGRTRNRGTSGEVLARSFTGGAAMRRYGHLRVASRVSSCGDRQEGLGRLHRAHRALEAGRKLGPCEWSHQGQYRCGVTRHSARERCSRRANQQNGNVWSDAAQRPAHSPAIHVAVAYARVHDHDVEPDPGRDGGPKGLLRRSGVAHRQHGNSGALKQVNEGAP
jgi:hypothetical protein